MLILTGIGDDSLCMIYLEDEPLQENIDWQRVLTSYLQALEVALIENPEFDKWLPRVRFVPEVEKTELSAIHGKLIALGFLKFELASQNAGMLYQLTSAGKRAIKSLEKSESNAA